MKTAIWLSLLFVLTLGCNGQNGSSSSEREQVEDTIKTLFAVVDTKRWSEVSQYYVGEVLVDMTSVFGGSPRSFSADQIVGYAELSMRPFEAGHSMISNFVTKIDGDIALVEFRGISSMVSKDKNGALKVGKVGGIYNIKMRKEGNRWKVAEYKYTKQFAENL